MDKNKGIIEAILFAAGRDVKVSELMSALELSSDEVIGLVESMKQDYEKEDRNSRFLSENDIIVLRGKGKFKISKMLGETKKGKVALEIEHYV